MKILPILKIYAICWTITTFVVFGYLLGTALIGGSWIVIIDFNSILEGWIEVILYIIAIPCIVILGIGGIKWKINKVDQDMEEVKPIIHVK